MRVLDLFSGIGGFSLGLERAGMETVAFCEWDEKARLVLSKHWPNVPQYHDVKDLTKEQLDNDGIKDIGLICGGYPCQPFSVAGKRKGQDDDRHLWPEFFRLIQEIRPAWVIAENVAGHINMGLDSVLADLESEAYQCQTFLIPACAVGAVHRRDRIWILANTDPSGSPSTQQELEHKGAKDNGGSSANGLDAWADVAHSELTRSGKDKAGSNRGGGKAKSEAIQQENGETYASDSRQSGSIVADTMHQGLQGGEEAGNTESGGKGREELPTGCGERSQPGNWLPEPGVGRVAHGVPRRVDRLKQLGNAVVPQVVEVIGRAIMEAEQERGCST